MKKAMPIIDIFAGPGGLGEGFSRLRDKGGNPVFDVRLSVEMEEYAHQTLLLRSFFRKLEREGDSEGLRDYYSMLGGGLTIGDLYSKHREAHAHAVKTTWKAELGSEQFPQKEVRKRIRSSLGRERRFVLIGGPPCQAYSLAGRSRNKGNRHYDPSKDKRQMLYREYLKILADHSPVLFVMENVKGLLSAKLGGESVLDLILGDLRNPSRAVCPDLEGRDGKRFEYRLFPFSGDMQQTIFDTKDFVIKAENHGIPQSRHRLIILGVRGDYVHAAPRHLETLNPVAMEKVISDLPKIRSGLSKTGDSTQAWAEALESVLTKDWFVNLRKDESKIALRMADAIRRIKSLDLDRGGPFSFHRERNVAYLPDWFQDNRLAGVCNHESRSHIVEDLHRYLFASCFARVRGRSPGIRDYPVQLLPRHKNLRILKNDNPGDPIFADRFRVQIAYRPATTITSHISKDGHYYIHPDPLQCRSLTVREAARIQTFPDNYFFEGPRTSQYQQVGNAVPPYLAYQIAGIVRDLLKQMRIL